MCMQASKLDTIEQSFQLSFNNIARGRTWGLHSKLERIIFDKIRAWNHISSTNLIYESALDYFA